MGLDRAAMSSPLGVVCRTSLAIGYSSRERPSSPGDTTGREFSSLDGANGILTLTAATASAFLPMRGGDMTAGCSWDRFRSALAADGTQAAGTAACSARVAEQKRRAPPPPPRWERKMGPGGDWPSSVGGLAGPSGLCNGRPIRPTYLRTVSSPSKAASEGLSRAEMVKTRARFSHVPAARAPNAPEAA